MMTLETAIVTFGYPALFIGTLLEGETIVIIAGFMVHRGYLDLTLVMIVSFLGSFLGDQIFFYIGKKGGGRFLTSRPDWEARMVNGRCLLDKYEGRIIFGFRFLYGLRIVIPFMIGASGYSAKRFMMINCAGALVWSALFVTGGYAFGQVLEIILADIRKYEMWIIAGLLFSGLLIWMIRTKKSAVRWQ